MSAIISSDTASSTAAASKDSKDCKETNELAAVQIIEKWKKHIPLYQQYMNAYNNLRKQPHDQSISLYLATETPITIYSSSTSPLAKMDLALRYVNTETEQFCMSLQLQFAKVNKKNAQEDDDISPSDKFNQLFNFLITHEGISDGDEQHISYININLGLYFLEDLQPLLEYLNTDLQVPKDIIQALQAPILFRNATLAEYDYYSRVANLGSANTSSAVATDTKSSEESLSTEINSLAILALQLDRTFNQNILKTLSVSGRHEFSTISNASLALAKRCYKIEQFTAAQDIMTSVKSLKKDALGSAFGWLKLQIMLADCDNSQTSENRKKRKAIMVKLNDVNHPGRFELEAMLLQLHFGVSVKQVFAAVSKLFPSTENDPPFEEILTKLEEHFGIPASTAPVVINDHFVAPTSNTNAANTTANTIAATTAASKTTAIMPATIQVACKEKALASNAATIVSNANNNAAADAFELLAKFSVLTAELVTSGICSSMSAKTYITAGPYYSCRKPVLPPSTETAKPHVTPTTATTTATATPIVSASANTVSAPFITVTWNHYSTPVNTAANANGPGTEAAPIKLFTKALSPVASSLG